MSDGGEGDESAMKKRMKQEEEDEEERAKNRGNYRCGKCNLPKKGHICPHSIRFKRRNQVLAEKSSPIALRGGIEVGCQAELDSQMTVRLLPLSAQGLPESYGMDSTFETPSYNFENAPYPQK